MVTSPLLMSNTWMDALHLGYNWCDRACLGREGVLGLSRHQGKSEAAATQDLAPRELTLMFRNPTAVTRMSPYMPKVSTRDSGSW